MRCPVPKISACPCFKIDKNKRNQILAPPSTRPCCSSNPSSSVSPEIELNLCMNKIKQQKTKSERSPAATTSEYPGTKLFTAHSPSQLTLRDSRSSHIHLCMISCIGYRWHDQCSVAQAGRVCRKKGWFAVTNEQMSRSLSEIKIAQNENENENEIEVGRVL